MPVPDRLSALDLAFLDLETPEAPLHVGWTIRLEGQAPSRAALRRHLEGRLAAVPRFRQRIVAPPMGDAQWADDPAFDIANHVHQVTLPAPGGPGELRDTAGALLSTPLDMGRPLWRMYLVDGLQSGWAVVGTAHHALVDGIAAIEVAMLLFDPASAKPAPAATPAPWTPARAPSAVTSARAAASTRVRGAAGAALGVARAARGSALRDAVRAVEQLAAPAPPTTLDRSVTAERLVAYASTSMESARAAGKLHRATVNDVLLAASTIALGRALRRRGDRPQALKALVPVSLRSDEELGQLGNRISFLAVELPVAETDAARIVRLIRSRTVAAKSSGDSGPLDALAKAADVLPGPGRRLIARAAIRAASFNAVISNVPGPPVDLALMGRPLAAVHPMVPLLHGHALSIGAVSYRGRLLCGLCADAAVVPDVVEVARDLEAAFDALTVAAAPEPPPWRSKARARRDATRPVG